ncbi:hypothetical protein EDB84DRAFT_1442535, partial [Lactarius hengduanensis]
SDGIPHSPGHNYQRDDRYLSPGPSDPHPVQQEPNQINTHPLTEEGKRVVRMTDKVKNMDTGRGAAKIRPSYLTRYSNAGSPLLAHFGCIINYGRPSKYLHISSNCCTLLACLTKEVSIGHPLPIPVHLVLALCCAYSISGSTILSGKGFPTISDIPGVGWSINAGGIPTVLAICCAYGFPTISDIPGVGWSINAGGIPTSLVIGHPLLIPVHLAFLDLQYFLGSVLCFYSVFKCPRDSRLSPTQPTSAGVSIAAESRHRPTSAGV